jgi:4-hydroxy-3-polyprenylbenzoate decarboxylase
MAGMSYRSLADFLEELSARGELKRIGAEVDPTLEVAEITRRVAAEGGKALLFERVRGATMPVVTNLLGTEARVCRALAIDSLDQIPLQCEALIQKNTPQNWFDRLKMPADESGANKFRPKLVKSGPCQQVVRLGRDVDLANFPLLRQWPAESGPSIAGSKLITQDLATGERGSGERGVTLCTLQAAGPNGLAIVDDGHSAFARHWSRHVEAGEKMTAALVVGGDPAAVIAAGLELSDEVDPFHVTGLLRGTPVDLLKCRTHALEVPADADLIFEGYFDPETPPSVIESAGAGGSYYRGPRPAPLLHVTAITHRSHAIFPALIDSGPHGEHGSLLKARERMLLPAVRAAAPDVVDLHLPAYGGPHRYAFVSIHKRYPFQARQIASALWGSDALKFVKFLILVDPQVNVQDTVAVLSAVGANVAPERDMFSYDGPSHGSDHANPQSPLGRHLALDATAKIAGEQQGPWPAPLATSDEIRRLVTERWGEYRIKAEG